MTDDVVRDAPSTDAAAPQRDDPGRVAAFSDGVFAIVITLLVLEISVPELGSGQSLRDSISEIRPTFTAWVISFFIIGMYWATHRALFAEVRRANIQVVWLNLLLLLPLCLVPYVSAAIGEYPDDPLALHMYGTVLITATIARSIMTLYLINRPHLLWSTPTPQARRLLLGTGAFPLMVYVPAMLVASTSTQWSRFLYFSVPALHLLLVAGLRFDKHTRSAAEDLS